MELLTHASAPSSRKDDEKFKRQAKAYLSFDSANISSIHRNSDTSRTEAPVASSPLAAPVQYDGSPVFMENTQDAWTALDSQLFAPSQPSGGQSIDGSESDENDDESLLPLPITSSLPPRLTHNALPPDESALLDASLMPAPQLGSLSSRADPRSDRQVQYAPPPSRLPQLDEHGTPSYLDDLSTIYPAETPLRRVSLLRASNQPRPQDDFSSPSDDVPSQLPSTYSISDLNSDPIHSDQNDAPTSSAWGSLPRGSAPQPWNGIIEEESPLKGLRSSGRRQIQKSSPLKQTQSLDSPRANKSAQIRPAHSSAASEPNEISSASLDRAVNPRQQQHRAETMQQALNSSFELRNSSASQARGRQPDNQEDEPLPSIARQEDTHAARSSFEPDFSSAPQAQVTQSSGFYDSAVPRTSRRQSLNQVLPTSLDTRFSSSPEAHGTQSTNTSDTVIPAALRQHTLDQLPPTSFESRFSSSPEAHGTPFVERESPKEKPAEASSSPSSKINLFQPREAFLTTDVPTSSSADKIVSEPADLLEDAATPSKSSPWRPVSSASEGSHIGPDAAMETKRRKLNPLSTPKAKPTSQEREVFKSLPTQIHPQPPPTGSGTFVSHITPQLQSQFWNSAELQGKYKPLLHRDLEQSERGYWQIDTRAWSPKIQIKFWIFLQSNIGSGVGGWGVWCLRGNDTEANEDEVADMELGTVKVFCWGEVVGHVWLLCYVASQARLKRVESHWIDADGKVVVRI
ncbi:hypothetical protein KCU81_g3243, partial [Aureobasidium melanogenum]|uniref:Uncharacterized protein n=1 Tax=Aureobasidium melanogenum (strain CBS 110374) TaxID=1043003 RepID=A0A074VN08_AURM1